MLRNRSYECNAFIPFLSLEIQARINMLNNFRREYNINRIFLSTIGLWPYQNKLVRSILWTFCFLIQISYYPFEVFLIYDHLDDAQLVFEGSYQSLLTTIFLIRHLKDFLHYDKMRWMYETIDDHWNIFRNDIEVQIMKEYSMLSRKFVICYSILVLATVLASVMMPIIPIFLDMIMPLNESRARHFAMEVEFRVNKEDYFLPILCYLTVGIVVASFITIGVDAMHITCTAHACSLFAAVSKQIGNIMLKANDNNNNISKSKYSIDKKFSLSNASSEEMIYRKYIICLKKYQIAIQFVNILNSTYQECALALLVITMLLVTLFGLRIIYVLDQLHILIKFVLIFGVQLFILLITCYSGQRIIDESWSIFHGAYAAEWYKFSPRLKSLLLLTLNRSIIPCGLKAGNMVPLSISTYVTVLRMSMSYFTTLLSI